MADGKISIIRNDSAPNDDDALFVLAQKLEYIRRCRVRGRGLQSRLRVLPSPQVWAGEEIAGLTLRKTMNAGLDKSGVKMREMNEAVRPTTAPGPTRTQVVRVRA